MAYHHTARVSVAARSVERKGRRCKVTAKVLMKCHILTKIKWILSYSDYGVEHSIGDTWEISGQKGLKNLGFREGWTEKNEDTAWWLHFTCINIDIRALRNLVILPSAISFGMDPARNVFWRQLEAKKIINCFFSTLLTLKCGVKITTRIHKSHIHACIP